MLFEFDKQIYVFIYSANQELYAPCTRDVDEIKYYINCVDYSFNEDLTLSSAFLTEEQVDSINSLYKEGELLDALRFIKQSSKLKDRPCNQ